MALLRPAAVVAAALFAALAAVAAAPATPAPAFHAAGRWIVDRQGRVFLPHGVNLIATRPPYYPDLFGADDARLLADEGFTAVRSLFLPAALEPENGAFDAAYLQRFVDQAKLLGRYGIATLSTLNQDDYAEACGGDGFPPWAVLAPCDDVWTPFWANAATADGVPVQDHYLAWWGYAMPRLAAAGSLLGFDLLNEPRAPDTGVLGAFWRRNLPALVQQAAGQLVFAEPGPPGSPAYGPVLPRGTGTTSHVYCWTTLRHAFARTRPTAKEVDGCIATDAALVRQQVAFATRNGYPLLIGEFGASDELREQRALVDALGEAFVPWTAYAYTARLDASGTPAQSLLRDDERPASAANAKQAKLDALVVPHPVEVAGTPLRWRYDRATRTATFRYSTALVGGGRAKPGLQTVLFVPARVYPTGYAATADGAAVVSGPASPWLRLVARPGAASVSVVLRPRSGGSTLTPLAAGRCGYDLASCGSS